MPKILVTQNPHEENTELFPYMKPFESAKNIAWEVSQGKAAVSTDTRGSADFGAGCTKGGDSQIGAKQISVTASGNGKVKVTINY